ncbi:MAG TPA: CHAT domain-containing protein, partial [Myxococcus sp.]|nr:CHAT domain-containing protein [Myxococcus sp.]
MLKPGYDKVLLLALATPVLVLTVLLARAPSKPEGVGVTEQFWAERRAFARIETRLTHPEADRYRPRLPAGGCPVPPEPIPLKDLARLEEAGDQAGIAAAYGLQGEWNQAASFLERMPPGPDRDSDLSAVYLSRGAHEQALRLLDGVLASNPKHPQALWNRALVLREMGLTMKAAETFDAVAALGEQGWSREARGLALTLREETQERARGWKAAREATLALLDNPGAPLPLEEARQHPGIVRQTFYEVVRAVTSKERALALLPLAQELDRLQGGAALTDYVRRVAARDFTRRAPLAKGYVEVVRGQLGGLDKVRQAARASGEGDLFLGTLIYPRSAPADVLNAHLKDMEAEVGRQKDLWLQLLLERELARKDAESGAWWKAEQRLFSALKRCREGAFSARCVDLELRLAILYEELQRLGEAEQHARTAWTWARQLREWNLEFSALEILHHISRSRNDFASGRAYIEEWSARGGRNGNRFWPRVNLAQLYYMDAQRDAARRELDAAAANSNGSLDLMFAATLAELARGHASPQDGELLKQALAGINQSVFLLPGDKAYARYIEGRFLLEQDRAKGEQVLREAIAQAKTLRRDDMRGREAWALGNSSLVTEAGRAGEYPRALELMAEQLETPLPARCALAISVHGERTVLVARGPGGEIHGHYEADRKESFSRVDSSRLVPDALRAVLRPCERVEVLAWPPVLGRTDLFPPDVAWSFRMGRVTGAKAPSSKQRLVVSSVEAPSLLRLPRLPGWTPSPEPEPTPLQVLTGAEATPSRVLDGMRMATEIEIHAHGLVDTSISDASLVVLSPEGDGRYALTADAVREQKLAGAPLVFLAACSAGRSAAAATFEPYSLPAAFIGAGARAVMASTVDIPDAAGRFFDGVRQRIRAGAPPAVA